MPTDETPANAAYFQRRERLRRVLEHRGPMTAGQLAEAIGWDLRDVSSKLQGLRRDGMAERDDQRSDRRTWWTT